MRSWRRGDGEYVQPEGSRALECFHLTHDAPLPIAASPSLSECSLQLEALLLKTSSIYLA